MFMMLIEQFVVASMRVAFLDPKTDRALIDVSPPPSVAKVDTRIALGMALGMYRLCRSCGDLVVHTPGEGWCHFDARSTYPHPLSN